MHDKSRMGVCLDTCHAFAAGYDFASEKGFAKMMEEFESVIGLEYLRAVHLNDSKGALLRSSHFNFPNDLMVIAHSSAIL